MTYFWQNPVACVAKPVKVGSKVRVVREEGHMHGCVEKIVSRGVWVALDNGERLFSSFEKTRVENPAYEQAIVGKRACAKIPDRKPVCGKVETAVYGHRSGLTVRLLLDSGERVVVRGESLRLENPARGLPAGYTFFKRADNRLGTYYRSPARVSRPSGRG